MPVSPKPPSRLQPPRARQSRQRLPARRLGGRPLHPANALPPPLQGSVPGPPACSLSPPGTPTPLPPSPPEPCLRPCLARTFPSPRSARRPASPLARRTRPGSRAAALTCPGYAGRPRGNLLGACVGLRQRRPRRRGRRPSRVERAPRRRPRLPPFNLRPPLQAPRRRTDRGGHPLPHLRPLPAFIAAAVLRRLEADCLATLLHLQQAGP